MRPQVHELEAEQQHWRELHSEAAAAHSSAQTPGKHHTAQLPVSRSASHLSPEALPGALQPQPGRLGRAGEQGNGGHASAAASPSGVVVAAEVRSEEEEDGGGAPPGNLDELDGLIRHAHTTCSAASCPSLGVHSRGTRKNACNAVDAPL